MQYKKIIFVGIIFLLSASSFFFCKTENQYRAIITVSMIDAAGGKIPVPSCKLVFGEENFAPDIKRTGYTDVNGRYEGEWPREVSLRVLASREINGKIYSGASIIRLSEGGVAEQEILIKEE
ncbi:MAG: hypothetical protein LBG80_09005 [Bacteroidales bacterium]|jgi:hypothetical protein|nr:hypothetical protein [Bacteroidales bacterium]